MVFSSFIWARQLLLLASIPVALCLGATACTSLPPAQAYEDLPELHDAVYTYTFRALDELEIGIGQDPGYRHVVKIGEDGQIDLPHVGEVSAKGMTRDQLREELKARFVEGSYYTDPQVTVNIVQHHQPPNVAVLGAVKQPKEIPHTQDLNLLAAVAIAGGTREEGVKFLRPLLVIRDPLTMPRVFQYDLYAALRDNLGPERKPMGPIPRLFPGDIVIVSGSDFMDVERAVELARDVALTIVSPIGAARDLRTLGGAD